MPVYDATAADSFAFVDVRRQLGSSAPIRGIAMRWYLVPILALIAPALSFGVAKALLSDSQIAGGTVTAVALSGPPPAPTPPPPPSQPVGGIVELVTGPPDPPDAQQGGGGPERELAALAVVLVAVAGVSWHRYRRRAG